MANSFPSSETFAGAKSAGTRLTRRTFLRTGVILTGGLALMACSQPAAPAPTPAATPQPASAATQPPKPAAAAPTSQSGATASYVPDQVVKVGVIVPSSGVYASGGGAEMNGINLALKEYEAKGWKFNVVAEDEKADPNTALRALQKLIERDQVHFIVGPYSSNVPDALRDPAHEAKMIMSTCQAGTRALTGNRCSKYLFRATPTNYSQAAGFGPWLADNLGKKAYVLTADYAAGTELADGIIGGFQEKGGQVVAYAKAPLSTTDFAPYMGPILEAQPDFVTGFFAGQNAIDVVKAFQQFGVKDKVKIAYSGYLTSNDLIDAEGAQAVEGIIEYLDFSENLQTPEFTQWASQFMAAYPDTKRINVYSAHGYEAAKAVLAGVEQAGSLDSDKIVAAMEKLDISGPVGRIRFNEAHQNPVTMYVTEVKDQKHNVIATIPNQEDPNKSECNMS
jgi:branched-chain amino acid transport system substrate-binding protein